MFNIFRKEDPDLIEAISDVFSHLKEFGTDSKEYVTSVDQLVKLHTLKKKAWIRTFCLLWPETLPSASPSSSTKPSP